MHIFLALAILGLAVYGAGAMTTRMVRHVASSASSTPGAKRVAGQVQQRGRAARGAAGTRSKQAAQVGQRRISEIWHEAFALNWLEKHRARRAANPGSVRPVRQRVTEWIGARRKPPASGSQPQQPIAPPGPSSTLGGAMPPPAAKPAAPAAHPAPATHSPSHPPSTNGKAPTPMTQPVSAPPVSGASGDLFTAANQLVGSSLAGGMQSKRRGVHTLAEAVDYFANLLHQFSSRLAEPDQGYPAAVWEPIAQAAAHLKGCGSKLGESDTALATLANTPMGDVATSTVKSPHHDQVNSE